MTLEWRKSKELIPYPEAIAEMEKRVSAIRTHEAKELIWLLEHPPLYTAGTSAKEEDLLLNGSLPVFHSGRGGQYTYHGPGQRVAYVMLDLNRRGNDVRAFVHDLEEWIIRTLRHFDIQGERRKDRVGVWIDQGNGREDKIAALGIRVRRWVSYHGIAINVAPDLSHYRGIVPCGISASEASPFGVTSLAQLGVPVDIDTVDEKLRQEFVSVFPTR